MWNKFLVPGLAVMAIALLGAAGASGIDEMASARITQPAPAAAAAAADGRPPLRHLILLGLDKGSLPGGLPYDELREERYEENYQEAQGAATQTLV
ncbi:hypothetical protein ACQCSU_02995 [Pseudarthrobacter sp. O4]|uniref:hypothetical protein n=1 Tax=Pseudarthrobacter sp. O4 TaxID=3418417 RepID=UPI003CFA8832